LVGKTGGQGTISGTRRKGGGAKKVSANWGWGKGLPQNWETRATRSKREPARIVVRKGGVQKRRERRATEKKEKSGEWKIQDLYSALGRGRRG